jgi:hypothetical protein
MYAYPGFFPPDVLSLIEPHISTTSFFERVGEGGVMHADQRWVGCYVDACQ